MDKDGFSATGKGVVRLMREINPRGIPLTDEQSESGAADTGSTDSGSAVSTNPAERGNANLIYILYLASLVVGITGLIGLIMAYVSKDSSPDWLKTHYNHQINIFWKGLAYVFAGVILSVIVVGLLILVWWLIWFLVHNIRGLQALSRGEPMPKSAGWGL